MRGPSPCFNGITKSPKLVRALFFPYNHFQNSGPAINPGDATVIKQLCRTLGHARQQLILRLSRCFVGPAHKSSKRRIPANADDRDHSRQNS
ncbi:hypothetical protein BDW75DRAFT_197144 [Aspergillus navahoensis]